MNKEVKNISIGLLKDSKCETFEDGLKLSKAYNLKDVKQPIQIHIRPTIKEVSKSFFAGLLGDLFKELGSIEFTKQVKLVNTNHSIVENYKFTLRQLLEKK